MLLRFGDIRRWRHFILVLKTLSALRMLCVLTL